jgi:radical SAM-linked protein
VDGAAGRSGAEPRQRWRLVVRRAPDAPGLTQRELAEAWEAALAGSGLPVAMTEAATPRVRVSFGAPLQAGIAAEAELIDVVLTERVPTWRVREALAGRLPDGWSLVGLYDVWLAGPPLPGRVVAADYRVVLGAGEPAGSPLDAGRVREATRQLLAARSLTRERRKGGGAVTYDLRPLLVDASVVEDGPPVVLRLRTRFHPELGTGRPEEVVAALGDLLGTAVAADSIVRERLELAGGS